MAHHLHHMNADKYKYTVSFFILSALTHYPRPSVLSFRARLATRALAAAGLNATLGSWESGQEGERKQRGKKNAWVVRCSATRAEWWS